MKRILLCALIGGLACGLKCPAQTGDPVAGWAGEWGAYTLVPTPGRLARQYRGERIAISGCKDLLCKLEINVRTDAGNRDDSGQGTLQIQSSTTATASLGGEKCTFSLQQSGDGKAAVIHPGNASAGCSDFCTPGADFNRMFALRTHTEYFGDHVEDCYLGGSPAQMAICNDRTLADQEHAWMMSSLEVADLEGKNAAQESGPAKLLAQCDAAVDAGKCLKTALDRSRQDLNQRRQAWLTSETKPGDPDEAERRIAAIRGRYQHSFSNGDVQGETFKSVDRMQIDGAANATIRYSLVLNFYNGHSCSRKGTATFRASGAFVDEVKDDSSGTCYFEIIPTAKGVRLRDPNGSCKMQSCGERGGYNGAGFTFGQRVFPAR